MSKRNIVIFFNSEGKEFTYETAAKTFGELKEQVRDYDLSAKRVVDSVSRVTFEADEAVLPEGDCVFYAYNRKSKAGARTAVPKQFKKITPDKLHTFPLDTRRKFASYLNKTYGADIEARQATEPLSKALRKWMLKNSWPETVATTSPGKTSKGAKKHEEKVKEKTQQASASQPSASQPGKQLAEKRIGPATLDLIDDKLDIIIETLGLIVAKRTAHEAPTSRADMAKDAARLKDQIPGVV